MDEFNMSLNFCPYLLGKTKDRKTYIVLLCIINLTDFYFWELQRTINLNDQRKALYTG